MVLELHFLSPRLECIHLCMQNINIYLAVSMSLLCHLIVRFVVPMSVLHQNLILVSVLTSGKFRVAQPGQTRSPSTWFALRNKTNN